MIYWETFDVLDSLTDEEVKRVLAAIRQYSQYGVLPDFTDNSALSMFWLMLRPRLDADANRYEYIREKRRLAGLASAEQRKNNEQQVLTNANTCQQNQPTTTPASSTTSASSPTSAPAPIIREKGKRDNEERAKGLPLTSQTPCPERDDLEFEEKRMDAIRRLEGWGEAQNGL